MKYFIIAGERSGDLHGGNLVKALKEKDPHAEFVGFGGDNMSTQGVDIKVHYKDLAFMGFIEVVMNLSKIKGFIKRCKEEIKSYKPDAIILIDYGGFNMKIAKFAKSIGIPVHYYITPKVWAWNQKRALKLKAYTDKMYVILPFEKDFFKKFNAEAEYVGNPVLDAIKNHIPNDRGLPNDEYIALLPGSRKQELKNVIPLFRQLALKFVDQQFVVATVDNLDHSLYQELVGLSNVHLFEGSSYDLLSKAKAAVVTSGTATLETALWKVPQVVVYKTSPISYLIAKNLVKVPYISLVNLVAEKEVVKEMIQSDMNVKTVSAELQRLIDDDHYRNEMLSNYEKIRVALDIGSASKNTAKLILEEMQK